MYVTQISMHSTCVKVKQLENDYSVIQYFVSVIENLKATNKLTDYSMKVDSSSNNNIK